MHASGKFNTIYNREIFLLLLIIQWLGQTNNSVTSDDQF